MRHISAGPRALAFALICMKALSVTAQQPAADTTILDRPARTAVLLGAARLLEENYVFPDSGRRVADFLRTRAASDAYASSVTGDGLGAAVTGDLRGLLHDKHVTLLSPAMAHRMFLDGRGVPDLAARAAAERARDYFFEEYRNLPGNIGYLRFRQFPVPDSAARETAVAAMRLLANADAVILDLRDNRGGVEGFNQLIGSYFFADTSRVLYRRYYRLGDSTSAIRVLAALNGPRMPAVPLFVLVNRGTGSAAENLAYALQTAGRATVVGEPTAGAANSSTVMPLPAGFAMQVPVARVTSPVTGSNWEGVGVQPDVRAPGDSAMPVAERLAAQHRVTPEPEAAASTGAPNAGNRAGALAMRSDSSPPRRIVMRGTVEVPLADAPDGSARPVVDVTINGRGPYRFLIETGARSIDMSPGLTDSLKLRHVGHDAAEPQYHVDSINVGAASFQDITVNTLPPGVTAMGIAGVLGLPFYQNLLLTVDYPARRLRFSRDTLDAPNGGDIVPLVRVGEFWGLPITIGGRPDTAVLDTQNSRSLMIPPALADALSFDGGLRVMGRARGAFGTTDVKGGRLRGDVTIGRYSFPSPFLAVIEMPPEFPRRPNVGSGLLRNFVVSLDQRTGRLRLMHDGPATIELAGPVVGNAPPSAGYAGVFGDRTVSLTDGKLTLVRPGGQPNELVAVARDTFGIKDIPAARIVFVRDSTGAVTALRVLNREGAWETAMRTRP